MVLRHSLPKIPMIGLSVRRSWNSVTVSRPPACASARADRMKGAGSNNPAAPATAYRPMSRRDGVKGRRMPNRMTLSFGGSGDPADVDDGEQVDADHVEEVGNVDALVGHGVVPPARTADDALHLGAMQQVRRIGAVKARRRNGTGRLRLAAYLAVGGVHRLDDAGSFGHFERQHADRLRARCLGDLGLERGILPLEFLPERSEIGEAAFFRLARR